MKRKLSLCALMLAASMLLSACGELFSKEYVSVKDYELPEQESISGEGRINVRSFASLKQAILALAYTGETSGKIVFDQSYDGDYTDDMASACWQVRTQDALCAYCVENISYDINKIVTIVEANVHISYSEYGVPASDILRTYYSVGMERIIKDAMAEGKKRLAVLVANSFSNTEDVVGYVADIYRDYPTITPKEPKASVTMFSGDNRQRLYEINLSYGMSDSEKEKRLTRLAELTPFADEIRELPDADRAFAACEYLSNNCTVTVTEGANTAYAALITHSADSEGIALAFVELCRRLSVDCQIVYGQKDWEDHCWNIIKVDGMYYHVDITETINGNYDHGLFVNDEHHWGGYRWDVASYPKCRGTLNWDEYMRQRAEAERAEAASAAENNP